MPVPETGEPIDLSYHQLEPDPNITAQIQLEYGQLDPDPNITANAIQLSYTVT